MVNSTSTILVIGDFQYDANKVIDHCTSLVTVKLEDYTVSPNIVFSDKLTKPIVVQHNGKMIVIAKPTNTDVLPGMKVSLASKYVLKKARTDYQTEEYTYEHKRRQYRQEATSRPAFEIDDGFEEERRYKSRHRRPN